MNKKKYADVTITFGDGALTYPSGGVPMPTYPSFGMKRNLEHLVLTDPGSASGLDYKWDKTNNKIRMYETVAGGTLGAEAAHTHAVALDAGATGAGSVHTHSTSGATVDNENAHTHAVLLDTGASASESAHTHAVALDSGTSDTESAHTHAVALDSGTSDAGAAHTHAFTGTAITPDTFTIVHNAVPATAQLYVLSLDGVMGYFCCDNSADSATDYFETAGGERYTVMDDSGSALVGTGMYFPVYFIDDGATADSRLVINNTITGSNLYVRGDDGNVIRLVHNAGAATEDAVYFDDDGADATLRLNGTLDGTTTVTTNATDDTYKGLTGVCAGANANESTHTHGPGSLADAASGTGSAHSHGPGSLADAASGAGSAHTHGPGTLADAASGVGSAHNHGITGLTIGNESAHTHAFGTLADTASGVGSSHTHTLTGTDASLAELDAGSDAPAEVTLKGLAIGW